MNSIVPTRTGTHLTLYRGVNKLDAHERIADGGRRGSIYLLNNLNSFSRSRERAGEFGDYILQAEVPLTKIFFYNHLLPGMLRGRGRVRGDRRPVRGAGSPPSSPPL